MSPVDHHTRILVASAEEMRRALVAIAEILYPGGDAHHEHGADEVGSVDQVMRLAGFAPAQVDADTVEMPAAMTTALVQSGAEALGEDDESEGCR